MNDHIPDAGKMACPKCGLPQAADSPNGTKFSCGTMVWKIGTQSNRISQSNGCIAAERDQLRARVEELERERDHANDTASAVLKDDTALQQRVEELEGELESHAWKISPAMAQAKIDQLNEQVKRLEDWCERMAEMLQEEGWESTFQNEFRKYMETKPKPEGLR